PPAPESIRAHSPLSPTPQPQQSPGHSGTFALEIPAQPSPRPVGCDTCRTKTLTPAKSMESHPTGTSPPPAADPIRNPAAPPGCNAAAERYSLQTHTCGCA